MLLSQCLSSQRIFCLVLLCLFWDWNSLCGPKLNNEFKTSLGYIGSPLGLVLDSLDSSRGNSLMPLQLDQMCQHCPPVVRVSTAVPENLLRDQLQNLRKLWPTRQSVKFLKKTVIQYLLDAYCGCIVGWSSPFWFGLVFTVRVPFNVFKADHTVSGLYFLLTSVLMTI